MTRTRGWGLAWPFGQSEPASSLRHLCAEGVGATPGPRGGHRGRAGPLSEEDLPLGPGQSRRSPGRSPPGVETTESETMETERAGRAWRGLCSNVSGEGSPGLQWALWTPSSQARTPGPLPWGPRAGPQPLCGTPFP